MKTQQKASGKPEHWEVNPDEYLGEINGASYYRLGTYVYKKDGDATRFYCTSYAWEVSEKFILKSSDQGVTPEEKKALWGREVER